MKMLYSALVVGMLALFALGSMVSPASAGPAEAIRGLLQTPEGQIDFAEAKLTVDRLVDPHTDTAAVLAELDGMVATMRKMLATLPAAEAGTSISKLKVLRSFLYRAGHWNGGKPFRYDPDDPFGQDSRHRLLSSYLDTRDGNCVSMPILFVILAERLGLDATLSTAPLHILVKYTDSQSGQTYNLEATSSAGFTRDAWYRKHMPMSDAAIANGVYLKTLSHREALAVIATPLIDHLIDAGRYDEAIAVSDQILSAYPAHAYALVKKGTAYHRLLQRDIASRYPRESDIPATERAYADKLYRANQQAFAQAEAMGWTPPQ